MMDSEGVAKDRLHGVPCLNSGLWVRRLLIDRSSDQGRYPASKGNDGGWPD